MRGEPPDVRACTGPVTGAHGSSRAERPPPRILCTPCSRYLRRFPGEPPGYPWALVPARVLAGWWEWRGGRPRPEPEWEGEHPRSHLHWLMFGGGN
jgi:hypothetical protein